MLTDERLRSELLSHATAHLTQFQPAFVIDRYLSYFQENKVTLPVHSAGKTLAACAKEKTLHACREDMQPATLKWRPHSLHPSQLQRWFTEFWSAFDAYKLESVPTLPNTAATISKTSQGSLHLDALRGAAALLVFIDHSRALYFASFVKPDTVAAATRTQTVASRGELVPPPPLFNGFGEIKIASEAVILFFVLSGYLVGGSVLRLQKTMRWSWRVYMTKRLTRLYMVLIPALLLGAALDYFGARHFGGGSVYTAPPGLELVTTFNLFARLKPLVLLGNLLFLTNIVVPYPGTNVALWSLTNEFWYYMAFPMLALVFASRVHVLKRLAWVIAVGAIIAFVGREVAVLFPIWIMGALVSALPRKLTIDRAKRLSVTMTVILLVSMLAVRFLHLDALLADYILGLVCASLLYVLVQQTQAAKESPYKTVAEFFSRISYTLYLFHVPMALFICGVINSPWRIWPKTTVYLTKFALADLFIVACAYALWKLFEANTDRVRHAVFERERRLIARPSQ